MTYETKLANGDRIISQTGPRVSVAILLDSGTTARLTMDGEEAMQFAAQLTTAAQNAWLATVV